MINKGDLLVDKNGILGWITEVKNDTPTLMKYGDKIYIIEWANGETSWQYASDVVDMKWNLKQSAKIIR